MQPISIQSYCFRHFKTIDELCTQLKAAGAASTELCGVHASFIDHASFADTIGQFRAAGVKLVAIGVELLTGDTAKDRPRFEFCRQAGIKEMSMTFKPEAMFEGLRNIEKLADEYDLKLDIHNHGGYDWLGNSTMLKYIFDHTSKRIGLHLDTAWAIDAKQNPVEMAQKFADRLYGVHIKDFTYDRARQFTDVVIGEGNLDLPKFIGALKASNFDGPLVIEYEGDLQNPGPALKGCVQKLQALA